MNSKILLDTAHSMVAADKGLLAMDESTGTCAIQQPALEIWQGKKSHVSAAQEALYHRARCNLAARRGEYNSAMETDDRKSASRSGRSAELSVSAR